MHEIGRVYSAELAQAQPILSFLNLTLSIESKNKEELERESKDWRRKVEDEVEARHPRASNHQAERHLHLNPSSCVGVLSTD
jgi:hypothetical protein